MIEGWNITTQDMSVSDIVRGEIIKLDGEPVFAEIGEKVRELTAELHEKIISEELKWSLMMTPLVLIKDLQLMCETEIARREEEIKEMSKEQ